MTPDPTPAPPKWASVLRDQARMTSTRGGLLFVAVSLGGYTLTDAQETTIMAIAGLISAIYGLVFPDRPPPS